MWCWLPQIRVSNQKLVLNFTFPRQEFSDTNKLLQSVDLHRFAAKFVARDQDSTDGNENLEKALQICIIIININILNVTLINIWSTCLGIWEEPFKKNLVQTSFNFSLHSTSF